jgi:hypothetical protein
MMDVRPINAADGSGTSSLLVSTSSNTSVFPFSVISAFTRPSPGHPPFNDPFDSRAASQALIDQIFLDGPSGDFDSNPALTNGCEDAVSCVLSSPHTLDVPTALENLVSWTENWHTEVWDAAGSSLIVHDGTTWYSITTGTWAVFTLVPEPGSNALATAALVTLGVLISVRRTQDVLGLAGLAAIKGGA